jgi:hypothetical protein
MKTLTIGDIHGRNSWMNLTHGSVPKYFEWKIAVEHGQRVDSPYFNNLPYAKYDKIIFIGDYMDSFDVSNTDMKLNFLDILFFKQQLKDRVVLLLGNHDVQYVIDGQQCSGFRPEMLYDMRALFRHHRDLFTMAHEETDTTGQRYLWTHAGVTSQWLEKLDEVLFGPNPNRFRDLIMERNPQTVADKVNTAWDFNLPVLYTVDSDSGGYDRWAGPLWVRPKKLNNFPLPDHNQIVGHTQRREITKTTVHNGKIHYYVDVFDTIVDGLEIAWE